MNMDPRHSLILMVRAFIGMQLTKNLILIHLHTTADYISKMRVAPTPVASRSASSSSFNLTNVKIPTIFHQNKVLDTLHDQQLFNWSYNRANSDENPGFLGIGHYFTRSGATTPTLLGGSSRSSSFSAATNIDEDPLAIPSIRIEDVYHITKD